MRQVTINREANEVTITETHQRVLNLDVTDNKGNWLASDANGEFYSNNPKGIEESLWKMLRVHKCLLLLQPHGISQGLGRKGLRKCSV